MEYFMVKIRFNTDFPTKSDKKWRLIYLGIERLVDDIKIECSSFTSTDLVERNGEMITKYHITALCKQIKFENPEQTKVIIL